MAAPRYSRDRVDRLQPPPVEGADSDRILAALGYSDLEVKALQEVGALL